jgi:hypothetical protein
MFSRRASATGSDSEASRSCLDPAQNPQPGQSWLSWQPPSSKPSRTLPGCFTSPPDTRGRRANAGHLLEIVEQAAGAAGLRAVVPRLISAPVAPRSGHTTSRCLMPGLGEPAVLVPSWLGVTAPKLPVSCLGRVDVTRRDRRTAYRSILMIASLAAGGTDRSLDGLMLARSWAAWAMRWA